MDHAGKKVLVSGASSGIGLACVQRLARSGYTVFAGVRTDAAAAQVRALQPDSVTPVMLDVTSPDSIAAAAEQLRPQGLYGLVNNAGIALAGPLEFLPLDEIRTQFEVNVFGQIALTQACLSLVRAARGRIVNMSSVSGLVASAFAGSYAGSKFALEALSDALRRELKRWRIRVAVIEPGNVKTPIWNKTARQATDIAGRLPPAARELYGRKLDNVERIARRAHAGGIEPEAVARAVQHALSARRPKTRYVVGRDARLAKALVTILPDALLDRIL